MAQEFFEGVDLAETEPGPELVSAESEDDAFLRKYGFDPDTFFLGEEQPADSEDEEQPADSEDDAFLRKYGFDPDTFFLGEEQADTAPPTPEPRRAAGYPTVEPNSIENLTDSREIIERLPREVSEEPSVEMIESAPESVRNTPEYFDASRVMLTRWNRARDDEERARILEDFAEEWLPGTVERAQEKTGFGWKAVSGLATAAAWFDNVTARPARALVRTAYHYAKKSILGDDSDDDFLDVLAESYSKSDGDFEDGEEVLKMLFKMGHMGADVVLPNLKGQERIDYLDKWADEGAHTAAELFTKGGYTLGGAVAQVVPGGTSYSDWAVARREAVERGSEGGHEFSGLIGQILVDPLMFVSLPGLAKAGAVSVTRQGKRLLTARRAQAAEEARLIEGAASGPLTPRQIEDAAKQAEADQAVDLLAAVDTMRQHGLTQIYGAESVDLLKTLRAPEYKHVVDDVLIKVNPNRKRPASSAVDEAEISVLEGDGVGAISDSIRLTDSGNMRHARAEEAWAEIMRKADSDGMVPTGVKLEYKGVDVDNGADVWSGAIQWTKPEDILAKLEPRTDVFGRLVSSVRPEKRLVGREAFDNLALISRFDDLRTRLTYAAIKRAPYLERVRRVVEPIVFFEKPQPMAIQKYGRYVENNGKKIWQPADEGVGTKRWEPIDGVRHGGSARRWELIELRRQQEMSTQRQRVAEFMREVDEMTKGLADPDRVKGLALSYKELGRHDRASEEILRAVVGVAKLDDLLGRVEEASRRGGDALAELAAESGVDLTVFKDQFAASLKAELKKLGVAEGIVDDVMDISTYRATKAERGEALQSVKVNLGMLDTVLRQSLLDTYRQSAEIGAFKESADMIELAKEMRGKRKALAALLKNRVWANSDELRALIADVLKLRGMSDDEIAQWISKTPTGSTDEIVSALRERGEFPRTSPEEWVDHKAMIQDQVKEQFLLMHPKNKGLAEDQADTFLKILEARARTWAAWNRLPESYSPAWYSKTLIGFRRREAATGFDASPMETILAGEVLGKPLYALDSPEFKAWFGDSKVVDEAGEPLVVYHGTTADFDEFLTDTDMGAHFGTALAAEDRLRALGEARYPRSGDPRTVTAYLKIENPYRMPDMGDMWDGPSVARYLADDSGLDFSLWSGGSRGLIEDVDMVGDSAPVQEFLRRNGYDGIVYKNIEEGRRDIGGTDTLSDSYIAFDPTQIKSAQNVGTWDPSDPRILYSRSEGQALEELPKYDGPTSTKLVPNMEDLAYGPDPDLTGIPGLGWREFGSEIDRLKTGSGVAKWLAESASGGPTEPIMRKVASALDGDKTVVRVARDGVEAPRSVMSGGSRGVLLRNNKTTHQIVWLRDGSKGGSGLSLETASHELVHAATSHRLDLAARADAPQALKDAAEELDVLLGEVKEFRRELFEEFDGTRSEFLREFGAPEDLDVHELVAYGMTNPRFQKTLAELQFAEAPLWTRFVRAVADLLGIDKEHMSALTELIRSTEKLMDAPVGRRPSPDDPRILYSRSEGRRAPDSPEFRRWFGKSKVVDDAGEPLRVYHGTPEGRFDEAARVSNLERERILSERERLRGEIAAGNKLLREMEQEARVDPLREAWWRKEERREERRKFVTEELAPLQRELDALGRAPSKRAEEEVFRTRSSGQTDWGYRSSGAYFTDSRKVADEYAESRPTETPHTYEVYLSIQNPYINGVTKDSDFKREFSEAIEKARREQKPEDWLENREREVAKLRRDILRKNGYDGEIWKQSDGTTEYIAFEPNQIKSTSNLAPTDDPNILRSRSEAPRGKASLVESVLKTGEGKRVLAEMRAAAASPELGDAYAKLAASRASAWSKASGRPAEEFLSRLHVRTAKNKDEVLGRMIREIDPDLEPVEIIGGTGKAKRKGKGGLPWQWSLATPKDLDDFMDLLGGKYRDDYVRKVAGVKVVSPEGTKPAAKETAADVPEWAKGLTEAEIAETKVAAKLGEFPSDKLDEIEKAKEFRAWAIHELRRAGVPEQSARKLVSGRGNELDEIKRNITNDYDWISEKAEYDNKQQWFLQFADEILGKLEEGYLDGFVSKEGVEPRLLPVEEFREAAAKQDARKPAPDEVATHQQKLAAYEAAKEASEDVQSAHAAWLKALKAADELRWGDESRLNKLAGVDAYNKDKNWSDKLVFWVNERGESRKLTLIRRGDLADDPDAALSKSWEELGLKKSEEATTKTKEWREAEARFWKLEDEKEEAWRLYGNLTDKIYKSIFRREALDASRGMIVFGEQEKALIFLFESARPGTLGHELGHFFRRDLSPELQERATQWAEKVSGFSKVGDRWSIGMEEAWAEAFELYLKTGKAPAGTGLGEIFARFKEWIKEIMSPLIKSGKLTKVDDEIRSIFDELFVKDTAPKGGLTKEAMVQFTDSGRALISVFENGDFTSMIHEVGHVFRRDLPASELETAAKWIEDQIGAKAFTGDKTLPLQEREWSQEAEEAFAQAFTKWLKDPSSAAAKDAYLKDVFEKLKGWLREIYYVFTGAGKRHRFAGAEKMVGKEIKISDDIQGVFERLIIPGQFEMTPVVKDFLQAGREFDRAAPGMPQVAAYTEYRKAAVAMVRAAGRPESDAERLLDGVLDMTSSATKRMEAQSELDAVMREAAGRTHKELPEPPVHQPGRKNRPIAIKALKDALAHLGINKVQVDDLVDDQFDQIIASVRDVEELHKTHWKPVFDSWDAVVDEAAKRYVLKTEKKHLSRDGARLGDGRVVNKRTGRLVREFDKAWSGKVFDANVSKTFGRMVSEAGKDFPGRAADGNPLAEKWRLFKESDYYRLHIVYRGDETRLFREMVPARLSPAQKIAARAEVAEGLKAQRDQFDSLVDEVKARLGTDDTGYSYIPAAVMEAETTSRVPISDDTWAKAKEQVEWLDGEAKRIDEAVSEVVMGARTRAKELEKAAREEISGPIFRREGRLKGEKTTEEDLQKYISDVEGVVQASPWDVEAGRRPALGVGTFEDSTDIAMRNISDHMKEVLAKRPQASKDLMEGARKLGWDLREPGEVWESVINARKAAVNYGTAADLARKAALRAFEDNRHLKLFEGMSRADQFKVELIVKNRRMKDGKPISFYGVSRDASPEVKALAKELGLVGDEEVFVYSKKMKKKAKVKDLGYTDEEILTALKIAKTLDRLFEDQLEKMIKSGKFRRRNKDIQIKIGKLEVKRDLARTFDEKAEISSEIDALENSPDYWERWDKYAFLSRVNVASYVPHMLKNSARGVVRNLQGQGLMPSNKSSSFSSFRARASMLSDINDQSRIDLAVEGLYHNAANPNSQAFMEGGPFFNMDPAMLRLATHEGTLKKVFTNIHGVDGWNSAVAWQRKNFEESGGVYELFETDFNIVVERYMSETSKELANRTFIEDMQAMFPVGSEIARLVRDSKSGWSEMRAREFGYSKLSKADVLEAITGMPLPAELRRLEPMIVGWLGEAGVTPKVVVERLRENGINVDAPVIEAFAARHIGLDVYLPTPAVEYFRWMNKADPLSNSWIMGWFDGALSVAKGMATVSSLAHIGMNMFGNYTSIAQVLGTGLMNPKTHLDAMTIFMKLSPAEKKSFYNKMGVKHEDAPVTIGGNTMTVSRWREEFDKYGVTEAPMSRMMLEELGASGKDIPGGTGVWANILAAGGGSLTGAIVGGMMAGPAGAASMGFLGQFAGIMAKDLATYGWKKVWSDEVTEFIKGIEEFPSSKRGPKRAISFFGERSVGLTVGTTIGSTLGPAGAVAGALAGLGVPKYMKMMVGLNQAVEMQARLTLAIGELSKGKTMQQAADSVDDALRNYSHLSPFERHYLRRIFFFYTWEAGNMRFQIRQLRKNPRQAAVFFHAMNGIFKGQFSESEIQSMPENLRWEVLARTGPLRTWVINGLGQQSAIEMAAKWDASRPAGLLQRLRPDALALFEFMSDRRSVYYGKGWDELTNVRQFKDASPLLKKAIGFPVKLDEKTGKWVPASSPTPVWKDGRVVEYTDEYRAGNPAAYYLMTKLPGWRLINEQNNLQRESFTSRVLESGRLMPATDLERAIVYMSGQRPYTIDFDAQRGFAVSEYLDELVKQVDGQNKMWFYDVTRGNQRIPDWGGGELDFPSNPEDEVNDWFEDEN